MSRTWHCYAPKIEPRRLPRTIYSDLDYAESRVARDRSQIRELELSTGVKTDHS